MTEPAPLAFASNVFMDPASGHSWSDLLQSEFLEAFFVALRAAMGATFVDYNFYLFSPFSLDTWPASASYAQSKKVLLFLSDETMSVPRRLCDYYTAIFKTHLPYEINDDCIFPFNLGFLRGIPRLPPAAIDARPIDVFFSGNLNIHRVPLYRELNPAMRWLPVVRHRRLLAGFLRSPLRRMMPMDFSARLPGFNCEITFTSGFAHGLTPRVYGGKIAQSKIVLCPRGFVSTETFRHIEAMRAGAVVVSEPLPDLPLYRDSPIVTVGDWHEGLKAVTALLRDPAELSDRQARSVAWYDTVLSETATAASAAAAIARATCRTMRPSASDV